MWARGAIVVISTGNDSNVSASVGYEQALFVGALGGDDQIAPFSDRGPFVDLVAPGTGIRMAFVDMVLNANAINVR